MTANHLALACALAAAMSCSAPAAQAALSGDVVSASTSALSTYSIDAFSVLVTEQTPSGPLLRTLVYDGFDDGILPPKGPDGETGIYLIRGSPWPEGSEVDGRLRFTPDGAVEEADPEGRIFLSQRARLATSTEPGGSTGLRSSGVFAVSGLFDLVAPGAIGEGYGIGLSDSFASQLGNDVLDLMVRRNQLDEAVIQLTRSDYPNQRTVLFQEFPLAFGTGDQILLTLLKADAGSGEISAFYQYVNAGAAVGDPVAFALHPTIFRGEDFTRAEIQAVFVVPEPATAALLATGLAVVAASAVRRRRHAAERSAIRFEPAHSEPCRTS